MHNKYPMTRQPLIFANWPTTMPTAPVAALTTTVSPCLGFPLWFSPVVSGPPHTHARIDGQTRKPVGELTGSQEFVEISDIELTRERERKEAPK